MGVSPPKKHIIHQRFGQNNAAWQQILDSQIPLQRHTHWRFLLAQILQGNLSGVVNSGKSKSSTLIWKTRVGSNESRNLGVFNHLRHKNYSKKEHFNTISLFSARMVKAQKVPQNLNWKELSNNFPPLQMSFFLFAKKKVRSTDMSHDEWAQRLATTWIHPYPRTPPSQIFVHACKSLFMLEFRFVLLAPCSLFPYKPKFFLTQTWFLWRAHKTTNRPVGLEPKRTLFIRVTSGPLRSLPFTQGHFRSLKVTSGHPRWLPVTQGHFRSLKVTPGPLRSLPVPWGHFRSKVVPCRGRHHFLSTSQLRSGSTRDTLVWLWGGEPTRPRNRRQGSWWCGVRPAVHSVHTCTWKILGMFLLKFGSLMSTVVTS